MKEVIGLLLFSLFQLPVSAELRNCNTDLFADHCDNVYTWTANDTCDSVADRLNMTWHDISILNSFHGYVYDLDCFEYTEGDQFCLSPLDVLDCGSFDSCRFHNPQYFCDTYTIERDNMTCQEIGNMFGISAADFKAFNIYNYNWVQCTPDWFYEDEVYCVSKPNFTDWDNCVALAIADHNTLSLEYWANETQTITPLDPSVTPTETLEYYYDRAQSAYTTRTLNATSTSDSSFSYTDLQDARMSSYLDALLRASSSLAALEAALNNTSGTDSATATATATATVTVTGSGSQSTSAQAEAPTLQVFGLAFFVALVSCLL
ncbi:hypothetical protein Cantr_05551 [Candida viswanathii]|uniref:LysM domain-containing protein n=1 Tax=Candida viswanathii TaxID=5486 RepID=A0A367XU18_9ASCO|nr:hypothetical protein Cantr_05551 [Candida viswanathii]